MFNSLLSEAGLILDEVRLLRHADPSARKGRTPYELWRDDRPGFDLYQSVQSIASRPDFGDAAYWASFGATVGGDTVFLGIYEVHFKGLLEMDIAKPHAEGFDKAGSCHRYDSPSRTT